MRIFLAGVKGQLGNELLALCADDPRVTAVQGLDLPDLDITDRARTLLVVRDQAAAARSRGVPLVVVNCAAYTAVDAAESNEELAFAVNATGPANLALACAEVGARLIHPSTDYVFPGDRVGGPPYEVDEPTGPTNAYGRTKLAGELAVRDIAPDLAYVCRTAWVWGAYGKNFVKSMAAFSRAREVLTIVDDQWGSPTWTRDLALAFLELAATPSVPAGVFHTTGAGETTWCRFAREVFVELGLDPARVKAITTAEYPTPATRPAYSTLSATAWADAGLTPLRDWRAALAQAFAEVGPALRGEEQPPA